MRVTVIAWTLLLASAIGCTRTYSEATLFETKDRRINRSLVGDWQSADVIVRIKLLADQHYEITIDDDNAPTTQPSAQFMAELTQIGDREFFFLNGNRNLDSVDMLRIDLQSSRLILEILNPARLKKLADAEGFTCEFVLNNVAVVQTGSTQPTAGLHNTKLLGSAEKIRGFLIKNRDDKLLFRPFFELSPAVIRPQR